MKPIACLHALLAALCLAAPVTGQASPDGRGDFHGRRHLTSDFHRRYFHRGPRYFYGAAPFFWGPAIGFSFYGSPGYYYPGYSSEGPDRPTYRGEPRGDADVREGRDGKEDLATEIQRTLSQEGYYHGPIDGDIGSGSRAAIRAYQSEHGLEVTGRIDGALLRSLHIE